MDLPGARWPNCEENMPKTDLSLPVAALGPAVLLLLACLFGGAWAVLALVSITLVAFLLDLVVARLGRPGDRAFPADRELQFALGCAHFLLLVLGLAALSGDWRAPWEQAVLFVALGLWFGQVSNANAHELIHRSDRRRFTLGKWIYISLFFGHHTSAHRLVHHPWAATPNDPNTAALGDGLYAFLPRAWAGSFRAGWEVELARLRHRHGARAPLGQHPYVTYLCGAAALWLLAGLLGGARAMAAYVTLAAFAQMQLLVSDYVQHYGLQRRALPGGGHEPLGPEHSWNAAHPWTSRMMLHAPRHSDHHRHPARPFTELSLPDPKTAPRLPSSLPVMAVAAFVPPLWHRLMDERARHWRKPATPLTTAA